MERSGMRWTLVGAQAMLNVRAVYLSDYWPDFHERRIIHEQESLSRHRHLIEGYAPQIVM